MLTLSPTAPIDYKPFKVKDGAAAASSSTEDGKQEEKEKAERAADKPSS